LSGDQWFELAEDAGFEVVLAEREWMRWFDSPINAVRSLKRVGANKVVSGAKTGLTGKHAYKQMLAQYENMREDQGIPLSYRILKAKMQLKRV
jgi:malonyl-CoA O-methyltransferase